MNVVLLGPQRRPTVDSVVRTLDPAGPLATVTAGWQEREPEDAELDGLLAGRSVNLRLYDRWLDVLARDPEYAAAELEHRAILDELQQLYRVQLDGVVRSRAEVARHAGRAGVRTLALADADAAVRLVDDRHLARVRAERGAFDSEWEPAERAVVAEHRAAVRHVLEGVAGLVLAGGHVGVLVHVLRLFAVTARIPSVVIAWSAGAMAIAAKILLFHDRAPLGPAHPEFLDAGLGLVGGCVLLPHARRRLRTDDPSRMAVLAERVAPLRCVVLDDGVRVDLGPDSALPPGTRVIARAGHVVDLPVADPSTP